jgi:hypothetical protein
LVKAAVSGDRLLQLLLYLTILLFVSAGMLPLARSRYPWAKWLFSIAVTYALVLTLRWGLNRGY